MALPKSRIFLLFCLAAIFGLGFGYKVACSWLGVAGIMSVMLGTLGWRHRPVFAAGLVGAAFVLASHWSGRQAPSSLQSLYGQKIEMVAVIDDDPAVKEKSISFPAQLKRVGGEAVATRIIMVLPRYPVYEFGNKLTLKGKLEPESEFNLKDNVSGQVVFPEVVKAEPGHGAWWRLQLYRLKHDLLEKIGTLLPEPHSGLLAGLLLGTRNMPQELLDQFRITGTSHIVAVSGFNVTIVAGFLDALLRRFGRSVSFYGSMLAIFLFVVITGASASVVRAGVMGGLVLLAQQSGRIYASVNSLLLAAAVMLVGNPKLLEFDIGFQLSFGALAGLLFVHPKIEERWPYKNFVTAAAYPTIAAQITTAPLILYHFGNFSLVSVFTNFLVLPAIPIAMLVGFAMLLAGYLLPFLGAVTGGLTWAVLEYVIQAVEWTSRIPLASLSELTFPFWAMVLYYLILIGLLKWTPTPRTA
jgi:competence protein ComEC